jgi:hypothetical protein
LLMTSTFIINTSVFLYIIYYTRFYDLFYTSNYFDPSLTKLFISGILSLSIQKTRGIIKSSKRKKKKT